LQRVLESLFSSEGEYVFVYDRDLRFVFVNRLGARLLGRTAEELIGQLFADALPQETDALARLREIVQSKRGQRYEREFRGRIFDQRLTPIFGDGEQLELVVGSARDITDQRIAEQRAAQLQRLTSRLGSTLSRAEIANVVIDQLHGYLGAAASVAYFADEHGAMTLSASRGLPAEIAVRRAVVPLDAPLPLTKALVTQALVCYETREALLASYPQLATIQMADIGALISVPLVYEGRVLGGIAFSFSEATQFDEATRSLLSTFALQCAQALERTRLYDDERRARARLEMLAGTSTALARAQLDLSHVLDTVCREVATRLPDACAINLVGADGRTLEAAAVHHLDPEAEKHIRMTLELSPTYVGDATALGQVAATREPKLIPVVPFEQLLAATRPEYRAHFERYPIASLVVVPLHAREQTIGTLTCSRSPKLPPFTAEDQRLLQDIADRAASAIANARLFDAERSARQLRDDFLSIAGHELRTPLAAMQLQVDSLRTLAARGTFETNPGLLLERLEKSARSVNRLGALIRQVLDVSQLVRGQLAYDREDVDLRAVVAEVVERASEHAQRAGSTITFADGVNVVGQWDRGRLDQVITNLIDNAIKYGEGKPIEISVTQTDGVASLVIRDQGIGIAAAAQDRVFGRFERGVSDRNYGGLGLGLWISRQIVEAHGGKISFRSEEGFGTTFLVELPLRGLP
jgi:PAS domain S-box-containing protein